MPSKSIVQQRLMGQAYGVKLFRRSRGKKGLDPKDIDPKYRKQILDVANSMTMSELKDFAETKHDGLPKEVEEGKIKDIYYKLDPDSQYDSSKEKEMDMQHMIDYRKFIQNKK